ncbi:MAG: biotin carboxylase [Betaproteobacteria bacterium]|nr:biotin carboxylase [Betaproteobacteria bacterium]
MQIDPLTSGYPAPDAVLGACPATGVVVSYAPAEGYNPSSHECVTRVKLAGKVAALKGCSFGGEFDGHAAYTGALYYVPSRTIVGCDAAAALGIRSEDDLFGGVVPYAFAATKTITHPLVERRAHAPRGWSHEFPEAVRHAVLEGYAAFTADDAVRAGARLLALGAVRVKPALALGGRGQTIVNGLAELKAAIAQIDPLELARCGVAIEQNLSDVSTFSVGQVRIAELVATYYGIQSLAIDNRGEEVYGGSSLMVARGGFDAVLALDMTVDMRRAVMHAQTYDTAAHACFPGFFASRRNYDIVQGRDAAGALRCGVLEQSWRVGGASGAEVAALERFRADPALHAVRAWCVEVYGDSEPPPEATVYFRGVDEKVDRITKYTMVEPYAYA